MGSRPRRPINVANSKTRRRLLSHRHLHSSRRRVTFAARNGRAGPRASSPSVTDKLEALKNLIPAHNAGDIKADQLFQETADYILLLRTQVSVLQRLVDFYGSSNQSHNVSVQ